jgi:hypothetical protein
MSFRRNLIVQSSLICIIAEYNTSWPHELLIGFFYYFDLLIMFKECMRMLIKVYEVFKLMGGLIRGMWSFSPAS